MFGFNPVEKPKHKRSKPKLKNIPKEIRAYVKERDHQQCVICSTTRNLQLHHLITKGRYDERLYNLNGVHDPRNLVTVCAPCHTIIHQDPNIMKEMLEYQKVKFGEVRKHV
jgi:5-methylcytosine-specific restriction endonuclease McrA